MNTVIQKLEERGLRKDLPEFRVGDSVRVHVKVVEGEKERIQSFEGIVIKMNRGANRATFTVRKVSYGVGVERIFPMHSPRIDKLQVLTRNRVRRARLYYLRGSVGQSGASRRRDLSAAPSLRLSVDGGCGLSSTNPDMRTFAVQVSAFGHRQIARLDIAEDLGARSKHHAIASDEVAAQFAHYQQSRREDFALDHSVFADHDQLDRANLAAEAALDSDRLRERSVCPRR